MKRKYLISGVLVLAVAMLTAAQQQPPQKQPQGQQGQKPDQQKKSPDQQPGNQSNTQPNQPKSTDQQPAQLFQGQSNLKSSKTTKDGATWGFNGIGPDGKVQQQVITASINSSDEQKAGELALVTVSSAELKKFAEDGKLSTKNR
jgi:hypothetical protein